MTDKRVPMSYLDPDLRRTTFSEVALGYTEEEAAAEAARCLHCKHHPCMAGCPVGVRIPDFIGAIAAGKVQEAGKILRECSALPAICGRVCPQERQCEKACVRGRMGEPVAIGRLERFAADCACEEPPAPPNGKKVAVVGSGPAGLTCAGELAAKGFSVTVFEALHEAGGVLVYGIPEFRLPKAIVRREVERLQKMGVEIVCNSVIGKLISVEELFAMGYGAVFLGTGAGLPRFMGIEGENVRGVFSANEYLTRINLMRAYEKDSETPVYPAKEVCVVGGGNVAMDAARCAVRLGAKVKVIYRRGEEELPARREEVEHAKEEGVKFIFLANPVRILSDGESVTGLRCVRMELGEPDASGRRSPKAIAGSEFTLSSDCVIMALGTSPNLLARTAGLACGKRGEILVDEEGATSVPGVFAGGDAVTGSATVILAMGAGKRAAAAIAKYLLS